MKIGYFSIIILASFFLFLPTTLLAQQKYAVLSGTVVDNETKEVISDATILLTSAKGKVRNHVLYTNSEGFFSFGKIPVGQYEVIVSFLGTKKSFPIHLTKDLSLSCKFPLGKRLRDVVVTAEEGKRITSSSTVGTEAMNHLQPSSFSDIVSLLPGGKSSAPVMGSVNSILLRETGTLNVNGKQTNNPDYAISSLGTLFMMDGAPINTDAEMQTNPSYNSPLASGKLPLNRGVDMRQIATDNIESVEFIRGIPSVEYGNITSGVVLIHRKKKPTPFYGRFKVDGYSHLVSMGKGLEVGDNHVLHLDLSFLNAKPDPRYIFETYKRLTGSVRYNGESASKKHDWEVSLDYTGSFDKNRLDPDINFGKTDEFFSDYNRFALAGRYKYATREEGTGLKRVDLSFATSQQLDFMRQTRLVAPERMAIAPTGVEPGDHEANLLGKEYVADYLCDGKPFSFFAKGQALYNISLGRSTQQLKGGFNYQVTKNFGLGQVYDLSHPIFTISWDSRPRAYYTIPALHQLAFYAEDFYRQPIGEHLLQLEAGLRVSMLPGLSKQYALRNKAYLDPRFNLGWTFPSCYIGKMPLSISLDGGWGLTTRMPTLNYLYPDPRYIDITQLGYYDIKAPYERSLFYVRTYIEDAANYDLLATRNRKVDFRLSFALGRNKLSISYFNERMNTGFRYRATASVYSYNKYDASKINYKELTGKPNIEDVPFKEGKRISATRRPENGSMINKEGVEFQLTTERIPFINTSLMLTGAWFRSTYSNSVPLFYTVSGVYGDVILADTYRGLYNWQDGSQNQALTTNFLLDTQIPQWGLIVTTAVESTWFISRRRLPQDGRPIAYLDANDGKLHPYTSESEKDPYLQHLYLQYSETLFRPSYIPIALGVNFKVSKKMGKHFTLSLFANNVVDYLPDYKVGDATLRRTSSPYFGMELRVSL